MLGIRIVRAFPLYRSGGASRCTEHVCEATTAYRSPTDTAHCSAMSTNSGKWSDAFIAASGVRRTSQPWMRDAYASGVNT